MFWLKCCPRCNGDLYEDQDIHGLYIACVQCSNYLAVADEANLRADASLSVEVPTGVPIQVAS